MADDLEGRVTELRIDVGSLKNQVHDHENDIRAFGPLVTEQALIRQMAEREFESLRKSLDGAHEGIRELGRRLEEEHRERIEGQIERKEELEAAVAQRRMEMEKQDIETRKLHAELQSRLKVAALGLLGVFMTSGGAVVVAIIAARGGK